MADQEQVKADTADSNHITPIITIGHDAEGNFQVLGHGLDAFRVLALLEHAKIQVLGNINPNKPRQVIPVTGRIPDLRNGRPH